MKKLKLKALELGATELLTREQLKNITAGSGGDDCTNDCQSDDDCAGDLACFGEVCPGDPNFWHNICATDPDLDPH